MVETEGNRQQNLRNNQYYHICGHLANSILTVRLNRSDDFFRFRTLSSVKGVVLHLLSFIFQIIICRLELQLKQVNEGVEFLDKKAHYHKPDSGITVVFESTLSRVGAN